ncbi:protein translocase subunit SecD [Sediminihabitans luteus]|nr:protein translocase subunit SecD [Sediminihabitans luteus]
MFATIFAGTKLDAKSEDNPNGASWAPGLALDLQGGTELILKAVTEDGSTPTDEDMDQSIAVIRQRIDSSGVAEAEITRQGATNIVVGIPGEVSQSTIDLIVTPAQMAFRPVLQILAPGATATDEPTDGATDAATDAPTDGADDAAATDTATDAATDTATDAATAAPSDGASDAASDTATDAATDDATPATDPSDLAQITPEVQAEIDAFDCTDPANLTGGNSGSADDVLVTCDDTGTAKYVLGPVEISGDEIDSASAGLQTTQSGATTGAWEVALKFTGQGRDDFAASTERISTLESPRNQFAIVLDGLVISAPSVDEIIPNGEASITGSFTRESATTLANQLNFGALPLTFEVQSQETISATLGAEQLKQGLIAGVIGLLLVALYSLAQYRALGLVTLASLVIASIVTYGVITLMSWTQGYRLSLPGVAGLIVAIGITADSFIVYFERIRDELRDGRPLVGAVERGWSRARRTILASDTVNFLAAVILYVLAVGSVRGFAFTLGLTTVIDLIVVIMFTHPVLQLLAKTKFFGEGHRGSGLDPRRLGVDSIRYGGRGRVVTPKRPVADEVATLDADREPVAVGAAAGEGRRMTIAERRAAERKAAEAGTEPDQADAAPQARDQDEETH